VTSFVQALELDRRNVDAHVARGAALANQKQWPQAIAALETALGEMPLSNAVHTLTDTMIQAFEGLPAYCPSGSTQLGMLQNTPAIPSCAFQPLKPATVNTQHACVDKHLHGPRQAAVRKMHICRPAAPAEIEPTDENAAKYLAAIRQRVPAALLPPPGRSPAVIPGARAPNASRISSTAVGNGPGGRSAVARGKGAAAAAAPAAPRSSPAAALRPASAAAPAEDQAAAAAEAGAFLAGLQNGEGTAALHGTPRDGAGANCCQDGVAFRWLPVVCC